MSRPAGSQWPRALPRVVWLLGALALVGWLWLEASPNRQSEAEIESALRNGVLGVLTESERADLQQVVGWLLSAVSSDAVVNVDQPFRQDALNIYSVSSRSPRGGRFAGAGNAVYEASIDTIFLDVELYRQSFLMDVFEGLTDEHIAITRAYLYFVLTHELGHRALHSEPVSLLGRLRAGRAYSALRELEADQFAVDRLAHAYDLDREDGSEDFVASAAGSIYLDHRGDGQDAWIDLAAMAQLVAFFQLYGDTPLSSLYADRSHEAFVTRCRRLLNAALDQPSLDQQVRSHLLYGRETLVRIENCRDRLSALVTLPSAPNAVALSRAELSVVTEDGELFRLKSSALRRGRTQHERVLLLDDDAVFRSPDAEGAKALWYEGSSELYRLDGDGSVHRARADRWEETEEAPHEGPAWVLEAHPCLPPCRGLLAEIVGEPDELWFIQGGEVVGRVVVSHLESRVAEALGREDPDLGIAGFLSEDLVLSVETLGGLAAARLRLPSFELAEVMPLFVDPSRADLGSWGALVPHGSGDRPQLVLFGSENESWTAHGVSAAEPEVLKASTPSLEQLLNPSAGVAGQMAMSLDPRLQRAEVASPDWLLVGYDDDSLYGYSPRRQEFEVLCHPGGLRWSTDARGSVALFEGEVARKVLVLDLSARGGTS